MPHKQKSLFPELDKIISVLKSDTRQDLVILLIPSHDSNEDPLPDQDRWAGAAMELFADLFRGATAFQTFAGIYKCDDGRILHDKPILVESYVARPDLENEEKLRELLRFAKRMGRETRQAAVALVINNVFHEITDYSGA